MADGVAPGLDPAVVGIDGLVGLDLPGRRGGEVGLDLGQSKRTVALERQQVVAAAATDGLGDGGLCADGIDRDQRAGQFQPLQQQRDGGDLVRLAVHCLLAEHEARLEQWPPKSCGTSMACGGPTGCLHYTFWLSQGWRAGLRSMKPAACGENT